MSDSQREINYRVIYLEIFPMLSNPLVRSKEHKIIRLVYLDRTKLPRFVAFNVYFLNNGFSKAKNTGKKNFGMNKKSTKMNCKKK